VLQEDKFHAEKYFIEVSQKFSRGRRTDGILRGEFMKSHEPLDLVEEHEFYRRSASTSRRSNPSHGS